MIISLTRLRLQRLRDLIPFLRHSNASIKQAIETPTCHYAATIFDRRFTFWTVTVWEGKEALFSYIGTNAHLRAMPKLRDWCSEAQTAHVTASSDDVRLFIADKSLVPMKAAAAFRQVPNLKIHNLTHPSENHLAGVFTDPKPISVRVAKSTIFCMRSLGP